MLAGHLIPPFITTRRSKMLAPNQSKFSQSAGLDSFYILPKASETYGILFASLLRTIERTLEGFGKTVRAGPLLPG
jgi:hypothetical protein